MSQFSVNKSESGERLDKFLVSKLRNISRNGIKELIDVGRVKVNGRRVVIAKWEMMNGDNVDVRLDGWTPSPQKRRRAGGSRGERDEIREGAPKSKIFINIVFEDRDIVVVEKPVGVVIQAGPRGGGTYVDALKEYLIRKHKGKGAYVKAVHRLDKDTSGLMVFAKSKIGERLVQQFKKHTIERFYLAIVDGAIKGENGRIDLPLKKGDFGHGKKAGLARKGEGMRALTLFHVMERYKDATLIRLDLKSGRTHQARVHMAAVNHPIVGDRTYGREGKVSLKRQALHSHMLAFKHPANGKKMKFKSVLPEDMAMLVDELRGE